MLFRRTNRYGYSRYYGGGGPAWIIRIVVTLVVILALVAGGVAWSLQKHMVYTAEGGHLELPWEKEKNPEDEPEVPDIIIEGDDSAAVPVVTEPEASTEEESQPGDASQPEEQQPEQLSFWQRIGLWFKGLFASDAPEKDEPDASVSAAEPEGSTSVVVDEPENVDQPEREALEGGLLLQHVSMGDLKQGYAEGDVKNVKGNGLMLFMKESSGRLNYVFEQALAEELGVRGDRETSEKLETNLKALKDGGYYTLAYLDCFRDGSVEERSDLALLDEDSEPWYDGERTWADPANEEYQDYVIGLVKEMAELGYDEVVLKNAAYPGSGPLDTILSRMYQAESFAQTMDGFYGRLAETVKDTELTVSVMVSKEVILNGEDPVTGQTLENLKPLGGRLWVEADAEDVAALEAALESAGYPENALGILTDRLSGDHSWCQMNVN